MLAERKKERVREKEREGERERAIIAAVIVRGRVRACEISYYPGTMSVQCHEKGESNLVCVHTRGISCDINVQREEEAEKRRSLKRERTAYPSALLFLVSLREIVGRLISKGPEGKRATWDFVAADS